MAPSDDSLEGRLHRLGRDALFVDLTATPPLLPRDASVRFADMYLAPAHQFRALVYLAQSAAAVPVERAACARQ